MVNLYPEQNIGGTALETKMRILRAALDEFAMHSISGARSRTIAKNAKVNHASLCYHFGGKEAIYSEIINLTIESFKKTQEIYMSRAETFLKSKSPLPSKAVELIKEILLLHFEKAMDNPDSAKMMLILRREEMYPTSAYILIKKEVLLPTQKIFVNLLNISNKTELSQQECEIKASMLFSLIPLFLVSFERIEKKAPSKHLKKYNLSPKKIFSEFLDKILTI